MRSAPVVTGGFVRIVKVRIIGKRGIEMRKDELENVIRIVKCLEQSKDTYLWYRQISKVCNIHHKTVSRLFRKYLDMFVEYQSMEPFTIKWVKLKPNADLNSILRYLSVKEKIENVRKG